MTKRLFTRLIRFYENIWSLSNTDVELGDGNKRVIRPNKLFLDSEIKATMFIHLFSQILRLYAASRL